MGCNCGQKSKFLVIVLIEDKGKYKQQLETWVNKLKEFYKIGGRSFLTTDINTVGDAETFYMHVLRFYLPHHAKETFEQFNLGLCVFSMQGFERRNKDSKKNIEEIQQQVRKHCCSEYKKVVGYILL